jgi:LysR family transcriptional regulator of beta-lactamase
MFDSSLTMVEAVAQDAGVALVPTCMFQRDLASRRLVRPFALEVLTGSYWLTWLKSRQETSAMQKFRLWMEEMFGAPGSASDLLV